VELIQPPAGLVVVPLQSPRRCWVLAHDADTDEWEPADFEHREALAVAMSAPRWDGKEWVIPDVAALVLTWTVTDGGPIVWVPEGSVF
jgi:hypothetical protein